MQLFKLDAQHTGGMGSTVTLKDHWSLDGVTSLCKRIPSPHRRHTSYVTHTTTYIPERVGTFDCASCIKAGKVLGINEALRQQRAE